MRIMVRHVRSGNGDFDSRSDTSGAELARLESARELADGVSRAGKDVEEEVGSHVLAGDVLDLLKGGAEAVLVGATETRQPKAPGTDESREVYGGRLDSRLVPRASGGADLGVVIKDLENGLDLTAIGAGSFKVTRARRVDLRLGVGEGLVVASGGVVGAQRAEVGVQGLNNRSVRL